MRTCVLVLLLLVAAVSAVSAGDCDTDSICNQLRSEREARRELLLKSSRPALDSSRPGVSVEKTKTPEETATGPAEGITEEKKTSFSENTETTPRKTSVPRSLPERRVEASHIAGLPIEIHPERVVWIDLSNTDVNRVVCTEGEIGNVYFSLEKGIEVSVEGKEAYIKFKILQLPEGGRKYVTTPSEFYVICAGETYGFIARPKKIPSRTIYLVSPGKKFRKYADPFKRSPYDKALVAVVGAVFRDRIPPSWEKAKDFHPYSMQSLLEAGDRIVPVNIRERQRFRIPGLPVVVRIFSVENPGKYLVQVNEKIFLRPGFVVNPIAVSLREHSIPPGLATKAVVVEKTPNANF